MALALLVVAAAGLWLVVFLVPREKARSIERWRDQLSATADDRRGAIERWVGERFGDARVVAGYPAVVGIPAGSPGAGEDTRACLNGIIALVAVQADYLSAAVVAADGRTVAGFGEEHGLSPKELDLARQCTSAGHALVSFDLRDGTKPVVRFLSPIFSRASAPASGAVLLTADPESWLVPFLRHQAVLSDTAETVLLQKEGDDVVFLTPLRHSAAKPLTFRRPLSAPGFSAAAAFAGREEFGEYVDYRGASVFATARRIRGTPWGLVVKVDREEALSEYRRWRAGALAGLGLALLTAGGLGYGAWHRGRLLAREAAAGNERRLAELVNAANNAVFVLSVEGRVLQANRRAKELYGYSEDELRGMTATDLRAPETREGAMEVVRQAAEGGLVVVETVHRRRDGSAFPVEVSIHHGDVQGERFLLAAVRDMTVQRAVEARIRTLNRLLRTISEINQLVVRERDRDRMLKEACRILVEHGEFRMAWVGFADEASGRVVPAAWAGHEDGYLSSVTIRFDDTPLGRGPIGATIREGRAVVVNYWETDERVAPWLEEARRRGYRSFATCPITVAGRVAGVLTVYMGETGAFDAEVTDLLAELSGDIAFAIESLDVAEKREAAEGALHESEIKFHDLFNNAEVGMFRTRLDGSKILEMNERFLEIFGRTRAEMGGSASVIHWADPAERVEMRRRLEAEGHVRDFECRMLTKQGEVRHCLASLRLDGEQGVLEGSIVDITERRNAEEALRENREMLRESQAIAGLGSYVLDISAGVWKSSDVLDALFGIDESYERSVEGWAALGHPDDRAAMVDYFANEVLGKGQAFDKEYRIIRRNDGSVRWVHGLGKLEFDPSGRPLRMHGTIQDITERKRADEELRASEAKYRTLVENIPQKIFIKDRSFRWVSINENLARDLGIRPEEAVAKTDADFFPPEFAAKYHADDVRIMETGRTEELEERYTQGGRKTWVNTIKTPVRDMNGEIVGLLGIFWDITERKRAEDLKAAIYEISEAAQQAPSLDDFFAAVHRIVGRLMEARNFYVALYDATTNLLSFPYFVDEVDERPDPFPADRGVTSHVVHSGQPLLATQEVLRDFERRGEIKPLGAAFVDWLGVPLRVQGRVIGVLAVQSYSGKVRYSEADKEALSYVSAQVAQAIERKRAENALRESEARFRQSIEAFSDGFVLLDEKGAIIEWNAALERINGITRAEALGKPLWDVEWRVYLPERRTPERYDFVKRSILETLRTGRLPSPPPPDQIDIVSVDGRRRTVSQSVFVIGTEKGFRVGLVIRDITDLIELEGQLRQAQKMEAVGSLAGGVAHDFNNLLQALLSQTQLLHTHADEPERVKALGLELGQQISHGASLTRQLLLFSRRETTRPELFDLNDAVRDATKMVRRLVRANIALEIDLAPEPLPLTADRGQLDQVLVNLSVNASDAMPEGGTLTIRTGALGGDRVWLSVADTGAGIPESISDRIFEPFFTTKGAGKGTGLGLSVVHGIVIRHGGTIEVESEVGRGTTFTVILPKGGSGEFAAVTAVPEATSELPTGRGERILVVEDEDAAREGLRDILRGIGYEVLAAASGEEALELPAEPPFDVLLTDLMLPGIAGSRLAAALQERWPRLKVILMSGYTEDEAVRTGVGEGNVRFLQKPFDMTRLAREMREALEEAPGPDLPV